MPDACRTTHEPTFCSRFFVPEKCSIDITSRSPMTMSAVPSRIGCDERREVGGRVLVVGVGVHDDVGAELERGVEARLERRRRDPCCWSASRCGATPWARATSTVRSVEPSSMTRSSTVIEAVDVAGQVGERGREAGPPRSRQGIWMTSFTACTVPVTPDRGDTTSAGRSFDGCGERRHGVPGIGDVDGGRGSGQMTAAVRVGARARPPPSRDRGLRTVRRRCPRPSPRRARSTPPPSSHTITGRPRANASSTVSP